MPDILLQGLTKTYGKGATPAVDGVSLTVPHGEFLCLLGPSGCGKTTILRMIAGIEHATGGTILMDGEAVDSVDQARFVPPERRRVGLVFQNYALWPHMTVARNVDFGLRLQNVSPAEREARCRDVMTKLKIADYADRYPAQLSGGQQQRVALARMLAINPDVLLLDEPLSNLDAALRLEMRAELRRIHETFGTTIIFVSHDQWEAMTLASTIAVMDRGRLQQVGSPDEIYARPANRFVAEFIGNPRINMVNLADTPARAGESVAAHLAARLPQAAGASVCGIRPEEIRLVPEVSGDALCVTVAGIMPTGGSWVIELAYGADRLFFSTQSRPKVKPGERIGCLLPDEALHLFDAEGRRLAIPGYGLSEAA